jgi:glutamyl-tRNA(Gln) amidotransferase subunit E
MDINYSAIGLKVGLEVHQQLETANKLFCSCKPALFKSEPKITFLRRLRPTQSELGQIDPAAFFEFQKGVKIFYEANSETSCLVEMDEEPPHDLNLEAIETALTIALMVNAKPIDEIQVMRKTVIDGSNTTGFQRTCVIALEGAIDLEGKKIPIQLIALEEDAARKMGEENGGSMIHYRIDRLGIPLIEVTTAPVLYSPQEAEKTALAIGRILRATEKVKRGLGTIRQDLNVSIPNGALIEIKGVQELELVAKVVEYEVQRQLNLLKIRNELKKLSVNEGDIKDEFVDVTQVFQNTKCKVILKAVDGNKIVLAVKLQRFANLLKIELSPGIRLGSEMADRAHFWGRVAGIFHTDEMPAYGITVEEVNNLKQLMESNEQDAIVFVADTQENATNALKAVTERAREALKEVPEETRGANIDGTTHYMRPRPSAARMYPETDVPPIRITEDYLNKLKTCLPELPKQKTTRLMKAYRLNEKLAKQILDSEYGQLFENIMSETQISPTTVAAVLTETLKGLKREGIQTENVSDKQIRELFRLIDERKTAKEAIPEIVSWLSKHENATIEDAIENLGLTTIPEKEIEKMIDAIIKTNLSLIEKKGTKEAFSPLMGIVMVAVRGKANAEQVAKILKSKLDARN